MDKKTKNAYKLILYSVLIIFVSGYIAYRIEKRKNKDLTIMEFINGEKELPPMKTIGYGLIFGIVFGFLDNFYLYLGIDNLSYLMPEGEIVRAGLGNAYSDLIGAIVGTYISVIAKDLTDYDQDKVPIWANTVGIVVGCLLGLYIPMIFIGRR